MLNDAAAHLAEWVRAAVDPIAVDSEVPLPNRADVGERVSCYLYAVTPRDPLRGMQRQPLHLDLDFLVTATAPDALRVNDLLGRVLVAAADRSDLEFLPDLPTAHFWSAFGIPPRPALTLRTVARVERRTTVAAPVLTPLVVSSGPLVAVRGRVLSVSGAAVAAAEVRVPGHATVGWTDTDGRFAFTALPPTSGPRRYLVRARGRRFELTGAGPNDDVALIIDPIGVQS